MASKPPITGNGSVDPIPPTPAPSPATLGERELITARYSAPSVRNDKVFRTFEIVYPADAGDDVIWERAQRAVFGVNCLHAAAQSLDPPPAPEPPPDADRAPTPDTAPPTAASPPPYAAGGRVLQGTVTDKQLKAIYAIARAAQRLNEAEVDARCQEQFGCRPSDLSKQDASTFIDGLKGTQAA
jgi:hypothetical protein